jgi:Zn-dependent M28 family amino/carboxypeptidase
MKRILAFILLSLPLFSIAQKKDKVFDKITNSITTDDLKKHLYIIAGPEMEGRNTPSPGLEKAADYIEAHFKSLGLKPGNGDSYRQYYPLYRDSVIGSSFKVNGENFAIMIDYTPGNNYAAEIPFSEIVFAGYGIVDEKNDAYKDLEVRGKAVVILDGAPADYKPTQQGFQNPAGTNRKITEASKKGAAAIFIVTKNFPIRNRPAQSNWSMNGYKASVNPHTFYISEKIIAALMGEDGKGIFDKMKNNTVFAKTYKANIDLLYQKTTMTTQAGNVMALLEGTDKKDEYVFITAHYDHLGKRDTVIYYGADDDGSGTVGVLEIAEAFAKAKAEGKGPRRSIVFMTVSGEEKGLWGSQYYSNHPVYPLEKTTVDLNIDMIGRADTSRKVGDSSNYIYVVGDDKISSELKPISESVNKKYMKMELDYKFNDPNDRNRIYFRSDHYNFAQKGIPIIFYYDGMLGSDYHRSTDTPDKINYTLFSKRTKLVFLTAWEMANRDGMLKRDIPLESPRAF